MKSVGSLHTAWYALAITLGAFLVFAVQPMMGRVILPWYGGSTSVWSACLLFFQTFLFAGYLYAHLLRSRFGMSWQARIHGAALLFTLFLLPLVVHDRWKPSGAESPAVMIVLFLGATVGLPYLLISAGSPLLQAWAADDATARPYRLYAFSNAGSLAGLLSYPFVIEPLLNLKRQMAGWSLLYGIYAACAMLLAGAFFFGRCVRGNGSPRNEEADGAMPGGDASLIFALALCGSLIMAAATHAICEDIAVVPLLWVLPLSVYILSFIVLFAWERFYQRVYFLPLLALSTVGAVVALYLGLRLDPLPRIVLLIAFLFFACFTCHGELVRLKPPPARLTFFYLILSAGGAVGTFCVIFAAPAVFSGYWELHAGIALCWGLVLIACYRETAERGHRGRPWRWGAALGALLALVIVLRIHVLVEMGGVLRAVRNFYGVLKVVETGLEKPMQHRYELINGGVLHGTQFLAEEKRRVATAYYGRRSGLAMALQGQRALLVSGESEEGLKIGVVGLGVGVIAAYAGEADRLSFYEINPAVESVAREYFSFLADSPADIEVLTGDARLVMEREVRGGEPRYDLLVVDAFTGDAIPVHLLTRECLDVYFDRITPEGRLAFNISNRYLDLRPLIRGLANAAGAEVLVIDTLGDDLDGTRGASWAIMARGPEYLTADERAAAALSRPLPRGTALWTDDYSNLFTLVAGSGEGAFLDSSGGKDDH